MQLNTQLINVNLEMLTSWSAVSTTSTFGPIITRNDHAVVQMVSKSSVAANSKSIPVIKSSFLSSVQQLSSTLELPTLIFILSLTSTINSLLTKNPLIG